MGYEGTGSWDGDGTWGYALDFAMGFEHLTTPKPDLLRAYAECHCNSKTEKLYPKHGHHFSSSTWETALSHIHNAAGQPSENTPCMCQHESHTTTEAFMHRNAPLDNTTPHYFTYLPPDFVSADLETIPLAIRYCTNKIPYHVTTITVETDEENTPKAWAAFQSPMIFPRHKVTMHLYHGCEDLKAAHQYLEPC